MAIKDLVIKDEDRKLFTQIQSGDRIAIMQGLVHPGAIYRVNAIISAVRYSEKDPAVGLYLRRLREDKIIMNGYKVSDFAYAALDILGIEKYSKNDIRVRRLITSKFNFD